MSGHGSLQETTACHEATDADLEKTEPDPGMMQSVGSIKEDSIVKPAKERRKRGRGRKLTAGRSGEPKELNRGYCGSRKRVATASRRTSHHARVARRKRNSFTKIGTLEMCGRLNGRSQEGPSVEQGQRNNRTRNTFARGTRILCMLWRRELIRKKDTNGTENRDFKEQRHLGNERITSGIYKKIIGQEIMNRAVGLSSRLRRIKNWT
jgi:hypothetical protein